MNEIINADDALQRVAMQAGAMAAVDDQFERGYAHLGWLLLEVAELQLWRVCYTTFREYLRSVAVISKKTPEALHRYFLTVRDLSDTFSAAQLELIGITKAMKLRQAKDYAIVLPKNIVDAALDSNITVKELHKLISTTLRMPEEEGDWMDLDFAFMVSPEQRALFEQTIEVAMHTEPLTKSTISKSAQMLDVFQKLAMEFLAAHCGDGQ